MSVLFQKSVSRLLAIQIIYSCEVNNRVLPQDDDLLESIKYIQKNFLEENGFKNTKYNKNLLLALLNSYDDKKIELDELINKFATKQNTMNKMDALARSILRVAILEFLLFKDEVKSVIIISDYIKISEYFFQKEKIGFINAILDKVMTEPIN